MERRTARRATGLRMATLPVLLWSCAADPGVDPPPVASPPSPATFASSTTPEELPWGPAAPWAGPPASGRVRAPEDPESPAVSSVGPVARTVAVAPAAGASPGPAGSKAAMQGVILSRVTLERRNVFEDDIEPQWLFQIFNQLHVTTQEHVIRRELLLVEGDEYDAELAAETERILRGLDFIADARVYPVPLPDGTAELHVQTRERFTLRAGGSVGIFGGTSTTRLALGESNLFGLGKEVTLKYREEEGKRSYGVNYKDPQFFTTHHVFRVSASQTTDGGSFGVSLVQPFRALDDDVSYGVDFAHGSGARAFYAFGDEFAEVPVRSTGTGVFLTRAYGPRRERTKIGVRAGYDSSRFGTATGDAPQLISVPGDTRRFEIGPTLAYEYRPFFAELENVDAMGVIEDVPLGFSVSSFFGVQRREEVGRSPQGEPVVSGEVSWAGQFWGDQLLTFHASARQRLHAGDSTGFLGSTSLHYYYLGLPYQTLAASLAFDMVRETENLPIQLTLGEDSGLRGYDVKFFTGDRRLRFNFEDRLFPDLELLSVRLGAVLFFDAGLAWDRRESVRLSDLYRSVGVGLRFGSPEVVRRDVVRLDLAFPLDDHPLQDFNVSLSISVGQVFEVFGNAEGLDREF